MKCSCKVMDGWMDGWMDGRMDGLLFCFLCHRITQLYVSNKVRYSERNIIIYKTCIMLCAFANVYSRPTQEPDIKMSCTSIL